MARKAQLGMQFNWLFVLIVGAIIISFFITVINSQQKKASIEEATDLVENLDTVFTTIATNPDTIESFSIMNAKVEFLCEPKISEYYIQGAGPVDTTHDVIFTPSVLRGDRITTWTNTWRIPFEVTVFTNMANDRTLFIFVHDGPDDFTHQLYESLPNEFKKAETMLGALPSMFVKGYDRFVVITSTDEVLDDLDEDRLDITHVRHVEPVGGLDDYGTVTFYDGSDVPYPREYSTIDMLWGSFFTQNAETYDCTVEKALHQLTIISTILRMRAESIAGELSGNYEVLQCYNYFEESLLIFDSFIAIEPPFQGKASSLHEQREDIENLQAETIRGSRCPDIY